MNEKTKQIDVLYLTKLLNKLIIQDFNKRLCEFGLTCQQGRVLFYVNKQVNECHCDVHQNDIELHFGLSKSTVSALTKRMEKNELIQIKKIGIYKCLIPTEKATHIIKHLDANKEKTINKMLKGFSKEEKDRIIKDVQIMISNMKEEEN